MIERSALLRSLEALNQDEAIVSHFERHQRVRSLLQQRRAALALARISLPDPVTGALAHLPPSIRLAPNQLTIDFAGAIDLLTQLTELSKAIGEDFETFERLLSQDPLST